MFEAWHQIECHESPGIAADEARDLMSKIRSGPKDSKKHAQHSYAGMSKHFYWPPSVTNLFSSKRLLQERQTYHDKMNNVRSHRKDEICGSRALCM